MKTATEDLKNLLHHSRTLVMADLFTLTLIAGEIYCATNFDQPLTVHDNVFQPIIVQRSHVRTTVGVEVDTLTIDIMGEQHHTIGGIGFVEAAFQGFLDGAQLLLERVFLTDTQQARPVGTLVLFSGRVSAISGARHRLQVTVKSDLELLNVRIPRTLYQPACANTLYDNNCCCAKTPVTGKIISVHEGFMVAQLAENYADGWFDQGTLELTSGINQAISRSVKRFAEHKFFLTLPLPNPVTPGDTFLALAGCDKTQPTCEKKFNNRVHFRGFPFIPSPETAL